MKQQHSIFNIAVLVAALGYFVDIYDLLLFGIIRVPSLISLGLTPEAVRTDGEMIISVQMLGLLIGGFVWGVMGDKKGRLSVLFGSILLYSVANIANGFVQTVNQYAWCRFIAGIGLAGELGAGITLVSELLPKEKRGIGTSMVAGIGLTGAVVAYFIKQQFDWRVCYFIGGGMGFMLLFLRVSVFESGTFTATKNMNIKKGNFLMLFNKKERFFRYLKCVAIGVPTWFVIGVLVSFSNNFAKAFNIQEPIDPGRAIMFAYAGISAGDILIGLLSQYLQSRKKALYVFYALTIVFMAMYFMQDGGSANTMYLICGGLGFSTGFWAIFVTIGAEHFGTNLRATAATTIPNVVRGALPLIIILFKFLREQTNEITGGIITGAVCMAIAITAAYFTTETFNKDLNFVEE
ncbi:MAG: MFS transporter [Chitinophagaceae bacterium]